MVSSYSEDRTYGEGIATGLATALGITYNFSRRIAVFGEVENRTATYELRSYNYIHTYQGTTYSGKIELRKNTNRGTFR